MLQQTQVGTVLPYYERWLQCFPSVEALAQADEQQVLSLWQGLGYYRRCRLFLAGARHVLAQGWPANMEEWLQVPGVGRYTACALASICLNESVPVVDGNVERVYARVTGCASARPALTNEAFNWGRKAISTGDPGEWNQAMMELGAIVCRPRSPSCHSCPLHKDCVAFTTGRVHELPVPKPRRNKRQLSGEVVVPLHMGRFGVKQIPKGQWSEGLWEFPSTAEAKGERYPVGQVRHTITNHELTLDVTVLWVAEPESELKWLTQEALTELPMPSLQRKVLRLALEKAPVSPARES